ncbi:hypothetical protein DID88_008087 [Monilinia fructigena]|uniref:Uncharacterized protein n=1 Tax=Monilinia fructigena TaxID=38457 RepID=A0A395J4C2_9HELO|nr:hypothetical protein DID88_008087 [Monilinia fructigena]
MTPSADQGPDRKRKQFQGGRGPKRQKVQKQKPVKEGSSEEVLIADVRALFAAQKISNTSQGSIEDGNVESANAGTGTEQRELKPTGDGKHVAANAASEVPLPERFSEIEVKVVEISSTGDGLALHPPTNRIYVVPFSKLASWQKGKRQTLDIEDCPIGTDAVRMGMKLERKRVAEELHKYQRGATILLRESTKRIYKGDSEYQEDMQTPPNTIKVTTPEYTDLKTCITDNNGESTEYIDNFLFTSIAGRLIISARRNAELNKLDASRCSFMAADAPKLFKHVTYPRDETVVVIDPPRKGCDDSFLSEDVGVLVNGAADGTRYTIESLRGFDFFPQTGHVEGVAVLSRVDGEVKDGDKEIAEAKGRTGEGRASQGRTCQRRTKPRKNGRVKIQFARLAFTHPLLVEPMLAFHRHPMKILPKNESISDITLRP